MNTCRPVGNALPPRRDASLIEAAGSSSNRLENSIIVPEARDRLLDFFERTLKPEEVRASIGGAIFGELKDQQLIFQSMIDTWPHLQKALREIKLEVRNAPWKVEPWTERAKDASPNAEKLATEVDNVIWGMQPDPLHQWLGFEGMLEALTEAYFTGHQVLEIQWQRDGLWRPRAVKIVPPRFYGYPDDRAGTDRLMLDLSGGQGGSSAMQDFPVHRFLIAVNSSHGGHPAIAAPLRALTPYWMAAVYGLHWAMTYAQLFGIPFRWATYADDADRAVVSKMLANIGSAGWGVFKQGTDLKFVDQGRGAGTLPQWKLLQMADEQCDVFMLGQSLTSTPGDSGSRALGEVHQSVRQSIIAGVCDFAGEVLTHQLVPAYMAVNHPKPDPELPGIWAKFEAPRDEKGLAERDEILRRAFPELGWSVAYIRQRHGVSEPVDPQDELPRVPG